jgi:hypothetical protein
MKTFSRFFLLGFLSLTLGGCKPDVPQANSAAEEETRRQLEQTRAAYEKQAAEMEARSNRLAEDLAALRQSIRDKESAELTAKLEAMLEENERLQADAAVARQRSNELADQLAVMPVQAAYDEVAGAADADSESWADPAADYSVFYEELNPYGRWLDVEGYGYAWHPNVAERTTWQPYVDGRWAWSDQGWAWDSNEPFGWACYHYGRWVRLARHGWVWVPGREWAPAWVAWRSGDDCVGWAPLPPGRRRGDASIGHDCDTYYGLSPSSYIFIRTENFCRPSYLNVCLPLNTVTGFFHGTINITNIVRVNYQQTNICVHRGGPGRDWLERRLGNPVPRAEVQVVDHLDRSQFRRSADRNSRGGITRLTVAPIPSARAARPAPPKSAERVARPTLVDAWKDVPEDRRQRLRDHIVRQSRGSRPVAANANANLPAEQKSRPTPPTEQTAEARPRIPGIPDRLVRNDRESPRSRPSEVPQGGLNQVPQRRQTDFAPQQEQARSAELQRNQRESESAVAREMAVTRKQIQEQAEEQRRLQGAQRQAAEAQERQMAAEQQEQEQQQQRAALAAANQQREAAQRERQAAAEQQNEARQQALAAQQAAMAQAREAQREQEERGRQQREALAAQRQQEQANAAAMRAQQEMAERRQAAEEAARQNAMRQQQEAAQRAAAQEAAQRAAQESARRASEEAARRSSENVEQRRREDAQRRDEDNRRRGR